MRKLLLIVLSAVLLLLVGCTCNTLGSNFPVSGANNSPDTSTLLTNDNIIKKGEPYFSKIILSDVILRAKATDMAAGCPSGDKECQLTRIYRYVADNYDYYGDPQSKQIIQSPYETLDVKGGDCEDLAILLSSLLENVGIKTYLVLTDNHAYALACGVNVTELWPYIKQTFAERYAKEFKSGKTSRAVIKDDKLFITYDYNETFLFKSGYFYYYGGNGSKFSSPIKYLDIDYSVSSTEPLTIYVMPTLDDYQKLLDGKVFVHYPSCHKQDVFKTSGSCTNMGNYGIIVLVNPNKNDDAVLDLGITFSLAYSTDEFTKDKTIYSYTLDNQTCVIADPVGGKSGFPGYDPNVSKGQKIAYDPTVKNYIYLNN